MPQFNHIKMSKFSIMQTQICQDFRRSHKFTMYFQDQILLEKQVMNHTSKTNIGPDKKYESWFHNFGFNMNEPYIKQCV